MSGLLAFLLFVAGLCAMSATFGNCDACCTIPVTCCTGLKLPTTLHATITHAGCVNAGCGSCCMAGQTVTMTWDGSTYWVGSYTCAVGPVFTIRMDTSCAVTFNCGGLGGCYDSLTVTCTPAFQVSISKLSTGPASVGSQNCCCITGSHFATCGGDDCAVNITITT